MVQTVIVLTKVRFENLLITWISAKGERCVVACTRAPHEKTKYVLQRSLQSCNICCELRNWYVPFLSPCNLTDWNAIKSLLPQMSCFTHICLYVCSKTLYAQIIDTYFEKFQKQPIPFEITPGMIAHELCFLGHALQQNPVIQSSFANLPPDFKAIFTGIKWVFLRKTRSEKAPSEGRP